MGGGSGPVTPPVAPVPDPTKPAVPVAPVEPIRIPVELVDPPRGTPAVPATTASGKTGEPRAAVLDRPKPAEPPFQFSDKFTFPLPDPVAKTPGDSAMISLNQTAAAAVLGGALLAPSNPAGAFPALPVPAAVAPVKADDKVDPAELKRQLEASNTKLNDIQRDLKQLTELLTGKKDERGFPIESDPGLVRQMKDLKDKLAALEAEVNKMKTQTSLRPPATGGGAVTPDPKAGKGTVRVVNEYPVQISIVVNGTSYRVEPTRSVDVDVPAGDFTYQLLQSGAGVTKSVIKEKETVTLRIK
jgi:hypothetical protein